MQSVSFTAALGPNSLFTWKCEPEFVSLGCSIWWGVRVSVCITHIKFEEVLLLFRGNLEVRSEGQVMDFHTLSQIHSLPKTEDIYVLLLYASSLILTSIVSIIPIMLKCQPVWEHFTYGSVNRISSESQSGTTRALTDCVSMLYEQRTNKPEQTKRFLLIIRQACTVAILPCQHQGFMPPISSTV